MKKTSHARVAEAWVAEGWPEQEARVAIPQGSQNNPRAACGAHRHPSRHPRRSAGGRRPCQCRGSTPHPSPRGSLSAASPRARSVPTGTRICGALSGERCKGPAFECLLRYGDGDEAVGAEREQQPGHRPVKRLHRHLGTEVRRVCLKFKNAPPGGVWRCEIEAPTVRDEGDGAFSATSRNCISTSKTYSPPVSRTPDRRRGT